MIGYILLLILAFLLGYCLVNYEGQDEDLEHCREEEY